MDGMVDGDLIFQGIVLPRELKGTGPQVQGLGHRSAPRTEAKGIAIPKIRQKTPYDFRNRGEHEKASSFD